ncbi:MAG: hypothetical protein MUE51_07220 [Thermoleophilia bacterium]|nr:hypothetical protein [Thermoleophilia bacterium]
MRRALILLTLAGATALTPAVAAARERVPEWRSCGSAAVADPAGLPKQIAWSARGITCPRARTLILTARRTIGASDRRTARVGPFVCVIARGEARSRFTCRSDGLGARGTVG